VRNEKKRNEDREPTFVDLRPFTGKAIVTFEDVPLTKIARRLIIISNPFDDVLKVSVTRTPKPEYNVLIEWSINKIPPQSQINLELVWNPLKVVSCREILQISDESGNKKDIAVILKSCELKKKAGRKVAPMAFHKKLKLKTPSPPRFISKPRAAFENHQVAQAMPLSPLRNATNTRKPDIFEQITFSSYTKSKENSDPVTPSNASGIFDNLRFTPQTETRPKTESKLEYLASLPTPVGTKRDDIVISNVSNLRSLVEYAISPEKSRRSLSEQETPQFLLRRLDSVPENDAQGAARKAITFDALETSSDEIDEIDLLLGNKTHILPAPTICVITEERVTLQKTFEVIKSHSLEEMGKTRIMSESLQDINVEICDDNVQKLRANQGSMPNLNEIDTEVTSIEHNRYFQRGNLSIESTVSHTDFQEIEICAQSSRLNLCVDFPISPSKPCESSSPLKVVKMLGTYEEKLSSPTMRRIQQEPEFKSPPKKAFMQMIISPPARRTLSADIKEMQRRETFVVPSGGRVIRATTWKQQQVLVGRESGKFEPFTARESEKFQPFTSRESGKFQPFTSRDSLKLATGRESLKLQQPMASTQSLHSLSSSSLASITSTSSTPASLTKGRLYNENYINAYNKKDPFSATTTNDPFLSSTMYLDERTLDTIEKTYMKWLNALVTIPADLESDHNEKIDIGKLFNDVQSKELTLAPTKEAVCSRYYTSRLDTLRTAAVRLFHSPAISAPLNKITVVMNEKNNRLDIKADRDIHLDLVLQRSLLELLLCYNPLWLRIGLEVIFNVQLNLTSNHDIYGMTRFIITNMFKSQYLAEKYSKFSQQKEYLDKLRKFTVKNFLFLIFFLDRAKEARLIKQNPCLFMKRAPYKDSNDILKKFASLVLANYGDIIRMLRRFEFTLTHKQTVIDEFDFAFKNLAVDLRDGVRLTKVMEIILMRDDLVQRVRVPGEIKHINQLNFNQ
jgi:abnormal spindle-like microcephaly-associated protein